MQRHKQRLFQFHGTYTTITFTTPDFEDYYAFTVDEDQTLTSQLSPPTPIINSTIPEPATFSLFRIGLAALPFARRALSRLRS